MTAEPLQSESNVHSEVTARPPHLRGALKAFLTALPIAVAILFFVPIGSVLINIALPASDTWFHIVETVLAAYIKNTLWLALGVGVGVVIIGTGTAWLVTLCQFPGRQIFEWALILPLAAPAFVIAYAYTDALQFVGPVQTTLRDWFGWGVGDYWFPQVRSLPGAIAMLTFTLYPYVYLLARAVFVQQSACVLEVSRTLGCTPWQSFRRVAVPAARPAIVAGTALALMETLADYGTVAFFGVQTFTTGIVRAWTSFGDPIVAGQLASVLLGFVFIALSLEQWSRARSRYHHTSVRYRQLPNFRLRGVRAAAAVAGCGIPVFVGFVAPVFILIEMALGTDFAVAGSAVLGWAGNSFLLGCVTAVLAVSLSLMMAMGARLMPHPMVRSANRVASLGYAIPGTVMAVGVLAPAAFIDRSLNAWIMDTFGVSIGLVFVGSIGVLVFAYLVRFLAVAFGSVESGLAKINPNMESVARVLGRGPASTFLRIHIPIMRASLLTAVLLVFVDVVKELPATLLLRPFNFDTLAVQAYNFAADERLAEAALPSLMIVAVGVIPVAILSKLIGSSRPGESRLSSF